MDLPKKECTHIAQVLEKAQRGLQQNDPLQLKALSNQTIHDSCSYQDEASITIAIILYALAKLVERKDHTKIPHWEKFVKRFSGTLELAKNALEKRDFNNYQKHITQARKSLSSVSVNLKPYIEEVMNKARINKASKIHEHGLSLEQTSKLLGVSRWDLANYIGGKAREEKQGKTISTKTRAKMALEFFQ